MKTIATTLGVARSNLNERLRSNSERHPKHCLANTASLPCKGAGDAALVQRIRDLVGERPTYGYRRITALLNRERSHENRPRINHKRVYRIMKQHGPAARTPYCGTAGPCAQRQGHRDALEPQMVCKHPARTAVGVASAQAAFQFHGSSSSIWLAG